MTALAYSSLKSIPSLIFPLATQNNIAPFLILDLVLKSLIIIWFS